MSNSAEFYNELKSRLALGKSVYVKTNIKNGEKRFSQDTKEGISSDFYTEIINPPQKLVLCGAGHVSQALCPIAAMSGFSVTVIDDRPELLTKERFSHACQLIHDTFESALKDAGGANTYFAVLTRGHLQDRQCLEIILNSEYAYCGMIGSRKKNAAVFEELEKSGYSKTKIKSVCAPIGLEIGAQTPHEISVSIAAELIKFRAEIGAGESFDNTVLEALCSDTVSAIATVCEKSGSAPRGKGSRMALLKNGSLVGSVGGGKAEALVIQELSRLDNSVPVMLEIEMNNKSAAQEGLICGGKVKILLEKI